MKESNNQNGMLPGVLNSGNQRKKDLYSGSIYILEAFLYSPEKAAVLVIS